MREKISAREPDEKETPIYRSKRPERNTLANKECKVTKGLTEGFTLRFKIIQ